jgi:alkylation response protein AidB-like acyl-CoA dehydrogenase
MVTNKIIIGFIVDMRLPGIRRNKIKNKLGVREVQNCQIYFDNVHLAN